MSVVVSVTPESSPPNTPAMHIGSRALQIIRSSAESLRSIPSSVVKRVPSGQVRTTIRPPSIFAASNACRGCPVSCRTKLVMSTTLFFGFIPIARSRRWSHSGEGATFTPVIVTPMYRGAASAFCTSTVISFRSLSCAKASTGGSFSLQGKPLAFK